MSCTRVHTHMCIPCCRRCVSCTRVLVHMHASCAAEGVCHVHVCVHAHTSHSAEGVSCTRVCAHMSPVPQRVCVMYTRVHPTPQRVYVMYTCAHTRASHAAAAMCTPRSPPPARVCAVRAPASRLLPWLGAGRGSRPPSLAGQLLSPAVPRCPPGPDISIFIFSAGGSALRGERLHCGCASCEGR